MSIVEQAAPGLTGRQAWALVWALAAALVAWLFFAVWPSWLDAILISKKAFINSIFNGVTLAGLYFLVASGFTLVFGLMRNVNLAHGSLYLFGAYIGYEVSQRTGIWLLGVGAGFVGLAIVGLLMQVFIFRRLEGDDLRQTLVTLGISIVAADLMLAVWTGITYQIGVPSWLDGAVKLPIITAIRGNGTAVMMTYPLYRLIVLAVAIVIGIGLWLMINRTRIGTMIRAGVDDRAMLSASGVNVHAVFAIVFAVGAGLAGFAGVVGGTALSVAPGEDVRYLLASLVVVIVGGMGSITGAAIGALLIGLAEQIGLVYIPTYGIVLTFIIMVVTLALRPQGIMGRARPSVAPILALDQPNKAVVAPTQFGIAQGVLAAALLLYPLVASEFFLTQIGAYSLIWGFLALSMMLLAGYGGMVSLAQITSAGVAAYTVAIFGTNNIHIYGFGWPWWVLVPFAVLLAAITSAIIGAISVRTEGIYTIMITLAIAAAFFYFAQQNYALFNGHSGFAGIPTPKFCRHRLARSDPVLLSLPVRRCGLLRGRPLLLALDLRSGAAGDPRQRTAHAGGRFRHHRPQGRRLFLLRHYRRSRRRVARLVQRPGLARHRRCRPSDQGAGHRGDRRAAPPDRSVPRRRVRDPDPDFRHRYCRRRTLQYADRFRLSGDRFRLAGWSLGPVGKDQTSAGPGVPAFPPTGGSGTSRTNAIHTREDGMTLHRRALLGLGLAAGLTIPSVAMAEDTIKIGVLATFEGAFAILGDDSMRGAVMAVDDFGGKVGGKKIEIIKGSSDGSPDSAVRAARKLVEQDGVKVLVGPLSGDEGLGRQGLRQDQAGRDLRQRHVGRAGHDACAIRRRTSSASPPTARNGWPASATMPTTSKHYKKVATLAEDYSFPYTQVFGFMAPFCKAGGHVREEVLGSDRHQGFLVGHRRDAGQYRRDLCRPRRRRLGQLPDPVSSRPAARRR